MKVTNYFGFQPKMKLNGRVEQWLKSEMIR